MEEAVLGSERGEGRRKKVETMLNSRSFGELICYKSLRSRGS